AARACAPAWTAGAGQDDARSRAGPGDGSQNRHHLRPGTCPRHGPGGGADAASACRRSEEHTSELQSRFDLVCRLLLEKKKLKPSWNASRLSTSSSSTNSASTLSRTNSNTCSAFLSCRMSFVASTKPIRRTYKMPSAAF